MLQRDLKKWFVKSVTGSWFTKFLSFLSYQVVEVSLKIVAITPFLNIINLGNLKT
jgi:hypothetical protein